MKAPSKHRLKPEEPAAAERDIEQFAQARPYIESAIALLLYVLDRPRERGADARENIVSCYVEAGIFADALEARLRGVPPPRK